MSKAWKVMLALVAVGTVAGSAVLAEDEGAAKDKPRHGEGGKRGEWFKSMDTDTNGTVSLPEFKASHEKRVADRKARMGDKWDEERAKKMPPPEETFKKMDADGSGEVTKEEMQKWHESHPRPGHKPGDGPKKEKEGPKAE